MNICPVKLNTNINKRQENTSDRLGKEASKSNRISQVKPAAHVNHYWGVGRGFGG